MYAVETELISETPSIPDEPRARGRTREFAQDDIVISFSRSLPLATPATIVRIPSPGAILAELSLHFPRFALLPSFALLSPSSRWELETLPKFRIVQAHPTRPVRPSTTPATDLKTPLKFRKLDRCTTLSLPPVLPYSRLPSGCIYIEMIEPKERSSSVTTDWSRNRENHPSATPLSPRAVKIHRRLGN